MKLTLNVTAKREDGALTYTVTDGSGASLGVVKSLRSEISPSGEIETLTLALDDAPVAPAAEDGAEAKTSKRK